MLRLLPPRRPVKLLHLIFSRAILREIKMPLVIEITSLGQEFILGFRVLTRKGDAAMIARCWRFDTGLFYFPRDVTTFIMR